MTDSSKLDKAPDALNIQALLDRLRSGCEGERTAIRKETDRQIDAIKNEAKAEKLDALKKGQKELEGLAEGIRRKAVDVVNRDRRDRTRREVGAAVDRVLAACKDQARSLLNDPAFAARLGQFLQQATCCAETYRERMGGGGLEVIVHPKLASACRQWVEDQGTCDTITITESESAEVGVVVLLKDTPYRIVNSVESRLLKQDEALRSLISKRLMEALEDSQVE